MINIIAINIYSRDKIKFEGNKKKKFGVKNKNREKDISFSLNKLNEKYYLYQVLST